MSTQTEHLELAPVVDDLSIYLICGRVTTERRPGFTHVASGLSAADGTRHAGAGRVDGLITPLELALRSVRMVKR